MNSALENLSTDRLIKLALTKEDAWDYIAALHYRGNEDVLIAAQALCQSNELQKKELGVNTLGQLGIPQRTFPDECLNTLLEMLETESDNQVLSSIGFALGHLNDSRAVKALVKFKNHSDPNVRLGVVMGISCLEISLAIDTLIKLTADDDFDVRNWATFNLGVQLDIDREAIRSALWQRIVKENTDENYEIYGEALVGLAKRKDERIISILLNELKRESVSYLAIEAAEEIGDSRLYFALIELKDWWDVDIDLLTRAIENCQPSQ